MLWGVNYYDMDGRVVRSFKQHYKGGTVAAGNYDEVSNTYDFTGAVLTSNRSHKVGGTETLKSLSEYTYDHRGRKLDTWQTMNTGTRTLLSRMEYDDLGQPYKKKLHSTNSGSSFLQTVTYGYTERGWLKTASAPLLSFELRYDNPVSGGVAQYNDNISGFEYTAPNSGTKSFMYTYDKINRLLESTYSAASQLNESILYDKNGNITWLRRGPSSTNPIYYTYASSSNSNQLSSVSGFKTGSFSYDGNGNLTSDGMRSAVISYNHLNLPASVTGATYTYDAGGNKLRSTQGSLTTDYISGVHYKNNVLSFMSTDEGRVVRNPSTGLYTYEYNLKDHLGNSRVSFDDNAGTARLIQEDEYYAFGLVSSKIVFGDKNNYLYNGKELQTALADVYDYGARFYDPVIGRFCALDPIAANFPWMTPYQYASNDPIRNIDLDGLEGLFFQLNPGFLTLGNSFVTPRLGPLGQAARLAPENIAKAGGEFSGKTLEAFRRGNAAEADQLSKNGLEKNFNPIKEMDPKTGQEGKTIPDAFKNEGQSTVEIKNLKNQSLTRQLRMQEKFSNNNGFSP